MDDPEAVVQADFASADYDVVPVADPNNTTMMQRLMKAKAMLELRGQGLNDMEIMRRYLLAMDINDVEAILPKEDTPDPVKQAEAQKASVGKVKRLQQRLRS